MKLKNGYVITQIQGDSILIPVDNRKFVGIVKGKETFGTLLELLQEEVSESELIEKMHEIYDAPEGAIERDVRKALKELRKAGALDG